VTRAGVLLRGGTVVDGAGGAPRRADVRARDGVIVSVGAGLDPAPGDDVVDVSGLEIWPGFIDVHSHDDAALFRPGGLDPKTGQGVTTTVLGNCGLGVAPSSPGLAESATPVLGPFPPGSWRSFADYLASVASEARAVNTVALVPHAPLRAAVMGSGRRVATATESDRIAGSALDALDAGAAGVSLGLMYSPGDSADRAELLALARAAAARDRLLVAHIRNEADHLRTSIDELASLAKESGAAVHISHLKVTGPANAGTMPGILEHLDGLRDDGLDLTCDVYPYDAGSTTVLSLFPPESQTDGATGLMAQLSSPGPRAAVLQRLAAPWAGSDLENQWAAVGPTRILLAGFTDPALAPYEGRSIAAVADERGQDPLEALADLVVATGAQLTVIVFHTDTAGMRAALQWEHTLVGSDGLPRESGYVHPRLFGTFSRAMALAGSGPGDRARMVRRLTGSAARRFGLADRGLVAEGFAADLQLIDPVAYADRATYESPRLSPSGVRAVYVAGVEVGAAPAGRFLPA
jgi:dihydroorotase/N-acyl-D-amino-acid deacylase